MASGHVDAKARRAQIEAGVIWEQVVDKAAEYGLARCSAHCHHAKNIIQTEDFEIVLLRHQLRSGLWSFRTINCWRTSE
jgi:hypothetical protein